MTELLAPAGTMEALCAAVDAGADAVYFGGEGFNARAAGKNFTNEEIQEAASYCRLRDVKTYITLNTVARDTELRTLLSFAEFLCKAGVDGVITQDLGLARLIRSAAPSMPLHASTQMTIHSLDGVLQAEKLGFRRVVVSRELPKKDLAFICKNSPIEIEAFIHGALCMCYSGQCYLSSVIGQRSGNRGTCAQPCRLRYQNGYELSLKDLSMASDFRSFLSCGVASLKIEGRLKSPEYVKGVTSIYRKLIDQQRDASKDEIQYLSHLFSRDGFTNGYFTSKKGKSMFGVRTQQDKSVSKNTPPIQCAPKKTPVSMEAFFSKEQAVLTVKKGAVSAQVREIGHFAALNRSTTLEEAEKQLKKTGATPFTVNELRIDLPSGLFLPVSTLNNLRRSAIEQLQTKLLEGAQKPFSPLALPRKNFYSPLPAQPQKYFYFLNAKQVKNGGDLLKAADKIWLPIEEIQENFGQKTGAILPPVFFDHELPLLDSCFKKLHRLGISDILCHNIGQIRLAAQKGLTPFASPRCNAANSASMHALAAMGCKEVSLSWETGVKLMKDLEKPLPVNLTVYGRIPVMITENCIIQNSRPCVNKKGYYPLKDRSGRSFPVFCTFPHRNTIFNAEPIYLGDKLEPFRQMGFNAFEFYFTTESVQEIRQILQGYENGSPSSSPFTRGIYFK